MAVAGPRFPLPARDRILLHLSDFPGPLREAGGFPSGLTQDGIAARTGLGRAHVAIALKSLREEGLVDEVKGRVAGEARRRKVYGLSSSGLAHGKRILSLLMDQQITLVRGGETKKTRLSEASFLLERKTALVELALAVDDGAVLRIAPDGLPVQVHEEETGAPAAEGTAEEAGDGQAAPSPDVPAAPKAAPETLFIDGEAPVVPPAGAAAAFGPARPSAAGTTGPSGPAAAVGPVPSPAPCTLHPEPSVWVKRGQLAAVWTGALVLAGVFIWLSISFNEAVTPEFMVMYFLVMVTLQAVLIGLGGVPLNVRAELGLFIGGFLALYGGLLLLGPPFSSVLWFTEGVLLLSTGLLLSPLSGDRKFQTLGAGAGAFIIMLSLRWMFLYPVSFLPLLLAFWMMVGALLVAARVFPSRLSYTAHLRTAAGLASGCFILSVGVFLVARAFLAEAFVEFLVGGVVIYYIAPKKLDSWDAELVACTVVLCGVVMMTTLLALTLYLGRLSNLLGT